MALEIGLTNSPHVSQQNIPYQLSSGVVCTQFQVGLVVANRRRHVKFHFPRGRPLDKRIHVRQVALVAEIAPRKLIRAPTDDRYAVGRRRVWRRYIRQDGHAGREVLADALGGGREELGRGAPPTLDRAGIGRACAAGAVERVAAAVLNAPTAARAAPREARAALGKCCAQASARAALLDFGLARAAVLHGHAFARTVAPCARRVVRAARLRAVLGAVAAGCCRRVGRRHGPGELVRVHVA